MSTANMEPPAPAEPEFAPVKEEPLEQDLIKEEEVDLKPDMPPPKWHQCPHCYFKTKSSHSLNNHVTVSHTPEASIRWFHCGFCDYRGKCKHNLIHHFRMRHLESEDVFQCEKCEYSSKVRRNLLLHMKSRHSEQEVKYVQCEKCSYKTKRKYYLKLHMMSKHPMI